jgi:hypothetical protein
MSPRANVRSLDSVQRFRPKVAQFEEDLGAALTSLRQEINRTLQWLDHDCPNYWQNQVRNGFDRVAEARTTLMRKSMMTVAGHRSECIDEKKALAKAKANLELAQQKVQACRQWSIKAHHAADEYTARVGRVEQSVGKSLPRIKVMLDRMIDALQSYASVEGAALSELDAAPPTAAQNFAAEEDAAQTAGADAARPAEPDTVTETVAALEPGAAPETGAPEGSLEPASPEAAARARS